MTGLVFGQVAPCRGCHGSGQMRGSGMDERQRQALRRAGEPVPSMQPCDECDGKGYVPPAVADARLTRFILPPPQRGPSDD